MSQKYSLRLSCPSCHERTDLFRTTCHKCGFVLRDRVPNIDLGPTILGIIEAPAKTFQRLYFSEKKNFLLFIIIFLGIKNSIIYQATSAMVMGNEFFSLSAVKWSVLFLAASVIGVSAIVGLVAKVSKSRIKIRHIATALLYPHLLLTIALPFLALAEFVIFGKYMFYKNPNIYFIHPGLAYLFTIIEICLYLWAAVLNFVAFWQLAPNKATAIIAGIFGLFVVYGLPYLFLIYFHI